MIDVLGHAWVMFFGTAVLPSAYDLGLECCENVRPLIADIGRIIYRCIDWWWYCATCVLIENLPISEIIGFNR